MAEPAVLDASAMVEALVGTPRAEAVIERLGGFELFTPAHFDAEVLSALGRLNRAGRLTSRQTALRLRRLEEAPVERYPLPPLLAGAWRRRHNTSLPDALYVELGHQLGAPVVTTDQRLAAASPLVQPIPPPD